MASYSELKLLFNHSTLITKVEVACIIAAETIFNEGSGIDNHPNRLIWAKTALSNSHATAVQMIKALLAANKDLESSQITSSNDKAVQNRVDAAVDIFADGS